MLTVIERLVGYGRPQENLGTNSKRPTDEHSCSVGVLYHIRRLGVDLSSDSVRGGEHPSLGDCGHSPYDGGTDSSGLGSSTRVQAPSRGLGGPGDSWGSVFCDS